MLVRFLGFGIEGGKGLSIGDFMIQLSKSSEAESEMAEHGRFLFIDSDVNATYHLGLIVTVKSQRKFCELQSSGKSFKVIVNNLKAESNLMEFNFFVLNKKNGLGLYQHYHQSCSVGQAMHLLHRRYSSITDRLVSSYKNELIKEGHRQDIARKKAAKKYGGWLKWHLLVRKEKLKEILEELYRIKSFEFDLAALEPNQSEFRILDWLVKKQRKKFTFIKSANSSTLATAISSLVSKKDLDKGRISAIDHDGLDRIIKIQDNPDNFAEYEYDEVAPHINNLDVNEFANSWVIGQLLRECDYNKHIFDAELE